jgi:hypothetical protein
MFFPEQFRSSAAVEDKFRGTEVSVPAPCQDGEVPPDPSPSVTRVNSTNVLDEGLRIREIGRRMNSKVKLVEIGVCRK